MPSDYVPPKLNTTKRFNEMKEKAGVAEKPKAATAKPDDSDARIKANAESMKSLSVEALIRRAKAAGGN